MSLLRLKEQCEDFPGSLVAKILGPQCQVLGFNPWLGYWNWHSQKKRAVSSFGPGVRVRKRQGPAFKDHEIYIDLPQAEKNLKLQISDVSRELCSVLCGRVDGRGLWGRMDTCICMAESLCYLSAAITRLLIGYTPVQHKKFKKDNKNQVCDITGFIFFSGFDPWVGKIPWRRQWHPTPVFLPGKSRGWRSLAGYSPQGHKESDTTDRLHFHFHLLKLLQKQRSRSSEYYCISKLVFLDLCGKIKK